MAFLLHSHLASLAARIWVERVTSEANPSDAPSRKNFEATPEYAALVASGATRLNIVLPDLLDHLRVLSIP